MSENYSKADLRHINGKPVQTGPSRICNACKKRFGTPPLIIAKDKKSAEDYRDVVTSIRFSVGGYLSGWMEVTIYQIWQRSHTDFRKNHRISCCMNL